MNCACKEWHRNGNGFRCYFGIKQGCRPAKIFANATAPFFFSRRDEMDLLKDNLKKLYLRFLIPSLGSAMVMSFIH